VRCTSIVLPSAALTPLHSKVRQARAALLIATLMSSCTQGAAAASAAYSAQEQDQSCSLGFIPCMRQKHGLPVNRGRCRGSTVKPRPPDQHGSEELCCHVVHQAPAAVSIDGAPRGALGANGTRIREGCALGRSRNTGRGSGGGGSERPAGFLSASERCIRPADKVLSSSYSAPARRRSAASTARPWSAPKEAGKELWFAHVSWPIK